MGHPARERLSTGCDHGAEALLILNSLDAALKRRSSTSHQLFHTRSEPGPVFDLHSDDLAQGGQQSVDFVDRVVMHQADAQEAARFLHV